MEKLSITHPLEDEKDFVSEAVDLSNYKNLRLIAFTDSPLDLYLVHSLDGKSNSISQRFKLIPGTWRSERFELSMKYVAVNIINTSSIQNKNIVVTITGQNRHYGPSIPIPTKEHIEEKAKSPFRKFVQFKTLQKHPPEISNLKEDDRLPGFIPEGSFLVGSKKNKLICMPRGNPYEIMMIGPDGRACWETIENVMQIYRHKIEHSN